ncbi:VirD4-like conjugal transfer protein, CD1115 family [Brevibacillus reuszeri]|uniref:VirD4-like conjugal transfer protein, CD1115 family n=1 Tax=Brevibacillus reuszeri TaxID=54915 RepID=UPI001F323142|nr:type IV secretory system conjugative DNA transfer family protein [Brevibacillus reuszeri]
MYIILLLDFLALPSIVRIPLFLSEIGYPEGINVWLEHLNPIESIIKLLHTKFLWQLWLILQVGIILLIIKIFWRDVPKRNNRIKDGIGGPEASGSGQFGTSRWMTDKEVEKSAFKWHLKTVVLAGGIVLGAYLDGRKPFAYVDTKDSNTLIIGATRSGKTRRLVFPTIWMLAHAEESMIVTDPKGELYDRSSTFLRDQGYEVKYLDFREPGRGNRTNYLAPVVEAIKKGDVALATKHAWSIAHMFVYQKPGGDKGESIWRDGPESVIAALILAVALEAPEDNQKHMYSVYKTLIELGKVKKVRVGNQIIDYVPLTDYFDNLPLDHPAREAYGIASLAPERTRASFFSSAAALLRLFADPSVAYLTSYQDHQITDVGDKKTAIFLIIPDEDTTRHPYAALYVSQAYDALVDHANKSKGRLNVRTNMILDEFGNMPPFPDMDTKLTVSLGRGVRWHMIIQSYSQLDSKYGNLVAKTLKANVQNTIYLLTTDQGTLEELSKRTGTYTVETQGNSYNVGKNSVSHGSSANHTGRALLTPDEISRWPDDMSLVFRGRMYPAKLPLPDLSLWPANDDLQAPETQEKRRLERVNFFLPDMGMQQPSSQEQAETIDEDEIPDFMDVD